MNGDPAPISFSDIEFDVGGIKFMWTGEFWVDGNEVITEIDMEWLGDGPGSIHFEVPAHHAVPTTFKEQVVRACAQALQKAYAEEIKFAVDEWSVSIAEAQFEHREAAE